MQGIHEEIKHVLHEFSFGTLNILGMPSRPNKQLIDLIKTEFFYRGIFSYVTFRMCL